MQPFIHPDYLLTTDIGRRLFHDVAADCPIYDFHCHLDAGALAEDLLYENVTRLWLAKDPYKHRAMRLVGVPEHFITGDATDEEKFTHWAETLPQTLGNPLFDWSALELARSFGIHDLLNLENHQEVWAECNRSLAQPTRTARGLLRDTTCALICTSDNLLDDLTAHRQIARSQFEVKVLPSLRADELLNVEVPSFQHWLRRLEATVGFTINTIEDWKQAVSERMDSFSAIGCVLADHGIDDFAYTAVSPGSTARLYRSAVQGMLQGGDAAALRSGLLRLLAEQYASRGWSLQLHLGAHRQTSTRLLQRVGKGGGYAAIGKAIDIGQLCAFFDDLERGGCLPRTIVYPLNPADYAPIATLTGSFPGDGVRGKIQLGPAWWYNDHALGMGQQLDVLSNYGMLSSFVGMTTDSRSPLSIHRHEYFRRALCDWIGKKVATGHFPADPALLAACVRGICYENVREWLQLEN